MLERLGLRRRPVAAALPPQPAAPAPRPRSEWGWPDPGDLARTRAIRAAYDDLPYRRRQPWMEDMR